MSCYFDDFSSFSMNPIATMHELDNRREISKPSNVDSEISMCEENSNISDSYHNHSRLFQESTSQDPVSLSHVAEDLFKSNKTCSTSIDETSKYPSQDEESFCEIEGFFVSYKQLLELDLDDFEKQITGVGCHEMVGVDEISRTSEHDEKKSNTTRASSSRVEKDDRKAALRLRNRLAARRYQERLKKQAITSLLEIEQIENENEILRIKIESAGKITKQLREFASQKQQGFTSVEF